MPAGVRIWNGDPALKWTKIADQIGEALAVARHRRAGGDLRPVEERRKKASDGLCTAPKWFWGMGGQSYWFVEGENGNLLGILATKEAQELLTKGSILVQDFVYGLYTVGREEMLAPYEHTLADLKIK